MLCACFRCRCAPSRLACGNSRTSPLLPAGLRWCSTARPTVCRAVPAQAATPPCATPPLGREREEEDDREGRKRKRKGKRKKEDCLRERKKMREGMEKGSRCWEEEGRGEGAGEGRDWGWAPGEGMRGRESERALGEGRGRECVLGEARERERCQKERGCACGKSGGEDEGEGGASGFDHGGFERWGATADSKEIEGRTRTLLLPMSPTPPDMRYASFGGSWCDGPHRIIGSAPSLPLPPLLILFLFLISSSPLLPILRRLGASGRGGLARRRSGGGGGGLARRTGGGGSLAQQIREGRWPDGGRRHNSDLQLKKKQYGIIGYKPDGLDNASHRTAAANTVAWSTVHMHHIPAREGPYAGSAWDRLLAPKNNTSTTHSSRTQQEEYIHQEPDGEEEGATAFSAATDVSTATAVVGWRGGGRRCLLHHHHYHCRGKPLSPPPGLSDHHRLPSRRQAATATSPPARSVGGEGAAATS
uniref:Uncharacterized protein n=1 Tax=Oryza glumipatula TaxID=40148 RepID=A0A0E0A8L2_9ORYZ